MTGRGNRIRTCVGILALLATASAIPVSLAAETHLLLPNRMAGSLARVKSTLEVKGSLKIQTQGKSMAAPLVVRGALAYDERLLDGYESPQAPRRSARYYDQPTADITIDGKPGPRPSLREDQRLVVANSSEFKTTLFAPRGSLSRDELDAITVPGDSLAVDALLPDEPVKLGDSWPHQAGVMAQLLGLDEVSVTDAKSVLKEIEGSALRMELTGKVAGLIQGAATEMQLLARYQFDRDRKHVTWFAMSIREKRERGFVGPEMEATARVIMHIEPLEQSPPLADAKLTGLTLRPATKDLLLSFAGGSKDTRYELVHDRRWHVVTADQHLAGLRLVDGSDLVAQLNLTPLPRTVPGQTRSLEQFQEDAIKAIGPGFGQVVKASQLANRHDYRIYRIEALGSSNDLSIQWHYYFVADKEGRGVALVFTLETKYAEQFAGTDAAIVDSIVLSDPAKETAQRSDAMRQ